MKFGVMFNQKNVSSLSHDLSYRGSNPILIIATWTPARGSGTLPPRICFHFLKVLILQVSQSQVLDQMFLCDSPGTNLTGAQFLVHWVKELKSFVQERLEVNILPLQVLHTGVVDEAEVDYEVLGGVTVVAAVEEGALVLTQPWNKIKNQERI